MKETGSNAIGDGVGGDVGAGRGGRRGGGRGIKVHIAEDDALEANKANGVNTDHGQRC